MNACLVWSEDHLINPGPFYEKMDLKVTLSLRGHVPLTKGRNRPYRSTERLLCQ